MSYNMKLTNYSVAAAILFGSTRAFVPSTSHAFGVSTISNTKVNEISFTGNALSMAEEEPMFFADVSTEEISDESLDEMTMEEEIEELVKKEMAQTKKISNLRNSNGVDYAPWMGISAEDEAKIRYNVEQRAIARRKRSEEEKSVSGNLYLDSQAQELSGTGLNYKMIGDEVELEFATKSEKNTAGFIVRRRAAKTNDFVTLRSYEDWGPLASQGDDGGIYRYLDSSATPGGWVYRISEVDNSGNESDLCQVSTKCNLLLNHCYSTSEHNHQPLSSPRTKIYQVSC
mmetsp:Transcript_14843/g.32908  ORF Transcript_14843/g.32908 Transcript_14843/m.32908 type:complete len:286 (-) Transcript_14843:380-1237(-)